MTVPIIEDYAPNIMIQVDIVGLTERLNIDGQKDNTAPPRPALGSASITLTVPPVRCLLLFRTKVTFSSSHTALHKDNKKTGGRGGAPCEENRAW